MNRDDPIKRPEFRLLKQYFIWIVDKLPNNITRNELMTIRVHIMLCDYIAADDFEKGFVEKVKFFWDTAATTVKEYPDDLEFFSFVTPTITALQLIEKDPKDPKKTL